MTVPELTIALTVKPTVASLVVEFPVILSPSLNVPITLATTSSVIESLPCLNACADITVAVAPNNCPLIDWLTTSSPSTPKSGSAFKIIFRPKLPSDDFIRYWLG